MNIPETSLITALREQDLLGWTLFGGFVLIFVAIRSTVGIVKSISRERTRREIAAYMGGLTHSGRADEERSPLRAEVLGAALYRAIEAVSAQAESRRLLAREIGQALAQAMPTCYEEILRDLQSRGVRPVGLAVR